MKTLSRIWFGIPLVLLLFPLTAFAQNKTEFVTVTGQTPESRTEILRTFIRSYVPEFTRSGKLARWSDPICPFVVGLSPNENMAVSERIKKDAQAVGAPVQSRQSCRPNLVAVFVQDPQDLMAKMLAHHWSMAKILLGDTDGPMQARKVSKITAPIQAWYRTGIKDREGRHIPNECDPIFGCAPVIANASNLDDELQSVFSHTFVVIDLGKIAGRQIGTIADYAAMLTLVQTSDFATCRNLPSITNLLVQDCEETLKTTTLSDADLAFMRGVYKANGGGRINLQIEDILREMEKSAAGRDVQLAAPVQPNSAASAPAAK